MLLWIAYKVLVGGEEGANISAHDGLMSSNWNNIVADVVMSFDNVVAVAGAPDGHIGMIALGVAISIPVTIFVSKFIVGYGKIQLDWLISVPRFLLGLLGK